MKRVALFLYGVTSYVIFLACFLYAIGFLGNFGVPKSIDSGLEGPMMTAIAINAALLGLFAVQHSVMARPGFKRLWTKVVPEPIERSTYVLLSSVALGFLFVKWQPIGGTIWAVEGIAASVLYGVFAIGWAIILAATFLINHFDLFGLRQVYLQLLGRDYEPLPFGTPAVYRWVRHPLYIGWLTVMWATPTMTIAHLIFAALSTAYILIAIQFEERDLVDHFGDDYRNYQLRVPMIVPRVPQGITPTSDTVQAS